MSHGSSSSYVVQCSTDIKEVEAAGPLSEPHLLRGPLDAHLHLQGAETQHVPQLYVRDVVSSPDDILLIVQAPPQTILPLPEEVLCIFGKDYSTSVLSVETDRGVLLVRCAHPANQTLWAEQRLTLDIHNGTQISTKVTYPSKPTWDLLAYTAVAQNTSVYVFVKGVARRMGQALNLTDIICVYGKSLSTPAISGAQEIVQCQHPPPALRAFFVNKTISVEVAKKVVPSVAIYEGPQDLPAIGTPPMKDGPGKQHFLCACTMVNNKAKFLREWVTFHGKMGVQRVFLYDNNSEDEIQTVVEGLSAYNVSRHPWPWVKTQQAGFSHCLLRAKRECKWVMFIDVDEFLYPKENTRSKNGSWGWSNRPVQPLHQLILDTVPTRWTHQLGQLKLDCHDFGPSGLREHPKEGVTVGYTCRVQKPARHKSIVLADAVDPKLLNVVHHFELKEGYVSAAVERWRGVINHYKYQVWDEFKDKFLRRVATFVIDWTEEKGLESRDRAPGLGTEAVEPPDWPSKFCEVNDTSLRDFVLQSYRSSSDSKLIWL
eukprot:jgi/Mesen1/6999/ME000365S06133